MDSLVNPELFLSELNDLMDELVTRHDGDSGSEIANPVKQLGVGADAAF